MKLLHHGQLIDDDGCFIVATRENLRALCPPAFDYTFPGVLLDGLRAGKLVAWQVDMESVSDFEITATVPRGVPTLPPMPLEVGARDPCIVLPWSQLTLAFDGRGGAVELTPGLAETFVVPAGWYDVHVGVQRPRARSDADLRWTLAMKRRRAAPTAADLAAASLPLVRAAAEP